jgi:hypothetical protein
VASSIQNPCESLFGRNGSLSQDPRLPACEVDDRRRRAGELATVEDGPDGIEDLSWNVREPPGIDAAVQVRARGGKRPDPAEELGRDPGGIRDADADRVGPRSRKPGESPLRIREHHRERATRHRLPGELGHELGDRIEARSDERDRLAGRAALERRKRANGLLPVGATGEPVDGVGRDDDELPGLDG